MKIAPGQHFGKWYYNVHCRRVKTGENSKLANGPYLFGKWKGGERRARRRFLHPFLSSEARGQSVIPPSLHSWGRGVALAPHLRKPDGTTQAEILFIQYMTTSLNNTILWPNGHLVYFNRKKKKASSVRTWVKMQVQRRRSFRGKTKREERSSGKEWA